MFTDCKGRGCYFQDTVYETQRCGKCVTHLISVHFRLFYVSFLSHLCLFPFSNFCWFMCPAHSMCSLYLAVSFHHFSSVARVYVLFSLVSTILWMITTAGFPGDQLAYRDNQSNQSTSQSTHITTRVCKHQYRCCQHSVLFERWILLPAIRSRLLGNSSCILRLSARRYQMVHSSNTLLTSSPSGQGGRR